MPSQQEIEAKRKIEDSLRAFQTGSLRENAIGFFESLGYRSNKTEELEPNTPEGLLGLVNQSDFLNPKRAHANEWRSVDFLFQLTDEDIQKLSKVAFDFSSKTGPTLTDKQIDSYIFFAIDLINESYPRTQLADITREINRLFPMPALVLFKHGNNLTLSIIDRRVHKRDAGRDVLKKVTLIKDIGCSSPHRGHLEILYDLAFAQLFAKYEATNFIQLEDAWRKALDSSALNKRFYEELAHWYYWASQQVEFPNHELVENEINKATNVIRLITRLIFVWFLKERDLVPPALFDRNELERVLKDLSGDKSTFYKAILQNLFFATLNMPMDDPKLPRRFRGKLKANAVTISTPAFRMSIVTKIISKEEVQRLCRCLQVFHFLTAACLSASTRMKKQDGKTWKQTRLEGLIDGFSELAENPLSVPNRIFFCDEHDASDDGIELNETFGTKNKRYKVRGLIDVLGRYKFTIAENTPIEEEVALDPELLGKVFENLLASYNPETGATARKQTGSFYTPREIVNYMVDESLIAYLQTKLVSARNGNKNDELGSDLRQLLSYTHESHKFSDDEVEQLIQAVDGVKVLDPACGSGAFPMGMLHKLVFILQKLDPSGELWRERQRQRAIEETEDAFEIGDQSERDERLREISEIFERNSSDYGRKLFLIENCIYGVDFQPIAIQIAKLRFFISLIIDQKINVEVKNVGITPLPNLETKLVAANTLLRLESGTKVLKPEKINEFERELREVRSRIFRARRPLTKTKWRSEDKRIRAAIARLLKQSGFPAGSADRIAEWQPHDQDSSVDWFDAEWMFGVQEGFDVVIGNPPYLSALEYAKCYPNHDRKDLYRDFQSAKGSYDIYVLFYERGIGLLNKSGELIYISPNKLLSARYAVALREFIINNASITSVVDLSGIKVFKEASVYPVVFSVNKRNQSKYSVQLVLPRSRVIERFEVGSFFFCQADSDTLRLLP
jgi:type I restriction-modification system DNA methylase subunit